MPTLQIGASNCVAYCLARCPTETPETNGVVIRLVHVCSNNSYTKFADFVYRHASNGRTHRCEDVRREFSLILTQPTQKRERDSLWYSHAMYASRNLRS